ncbi:MAG: cob(I)yrinic acid a,c-diamide adenosyltransferase [Desulfobulbaceae bacterium]|nr:cob(I)yrinic acid a,c-diamide adenosyltransferase [Desulfobulbaceae bacterium]
MSKIECTGKGYSHVYTGNGKGKTTAALGLAFRAIGCGLKVYVGQFMKGQEYHELNTARMLSDHIVIEQYGQDTFVHVQNPPDPEDVAMAKAGYGKLRSALLSGEYQVVIADESITATFFNLLSTQELLKLIEEKPYGVELILTGRYAPEEIIAAADLATEMKELKHYYQAGVPARDGIER